MLLETSKKLLRLLLLQLHFDIVVELAHVPRLHILVVAEALKEGPAGRLSRPFMLADARGLRCAPCRCGARSSQTLVAAADPQNARRPPLWRCLPPP